MKKCSGVNGVIEECLLNVLLILKLLTLPDLLAILLTLFSPRVSRKPASRVFFSQCSVRREVHKEGLHITEWYDGLGKIAAFVLLGFVFSSNMDAYLHLDNFLTLAFRQHPNIIRSTLNERRCDFIGINLGRGRHLLFREIYPPLSTVLFAITTSRRHTSRPRQTAWDPRHVE